VRYMERTTVRAQQCRLEMEQQRKLPRETVASFSVTPFGCDRVRQPMFPYGLNRVRFQPVGNGTGASFQIPLSMSDA